MTKAVGVTPYAERIERDRWAGLTPASSSRRGTPPRRLSSARIAVQAFASQLRCARARLCVRRCETARSRSIQKRIRSYGPGSSWKRPRACSKTAIAAGAWKVTGPRRRRPAAGRVGPGQVEEAPPGRAGEGDVDELEPVRRRAADRVPIVGRTRTTSPATRSLDAAGQQVLAAARHDAHELVEVRVRVQLGVAGRAPGSAPGPRGTAGRTRATRTAAPAPHQHATSSRQLVASTEPCPTRSMKTCSRPTATSSSATSSTRS